MDTHGASTPDYFRIDDLLDFSNDEIFSSSTASTSSSVASDHHHHHLISAPENSLVHQFYHDTSDHFNPLHTDFTYPLSLPTDEVAELEWLSRFVDDSFADFPASSLGGTVNGRPSNASFPVKARGKRTKSTLANASPWITSPQDSSYPVTAAGKTKSKNEMTRASSPTVEGGEVRRCSHCASEKTPQWRTGPLGPKTLCNACGVRFKSGRLVPEYRPAASPTFVLTQHSNSHRKVMELRRQKEMLRHQ